ncbi:MAG: HD-GYP domain-containing protein [Actinobacteria bacterium]|nr:HD-GYP domain-containing protein [Actinomycetota bacterium]MBV8563607.1 HD-GYP domain-containing protein [Actinomycetota bacterium]
MATRRAAGLQLAQDVWDGRPSSVPLVRAGAKLTPEWSEALLSAGVHAVFIEDELSKGIEVEPALSASVRAEAQRGISQAFKAAPAALERGEPLGDQALGQLESVARLIAEQVSRARDAVVAFSDLGCADAYTLQHSINVTVIGLLVARRLFNDIGRLDGLSRRSFERVDDAIVRLGVGLLLHDIGKLALPKQLLERNGPLDAEEWELMRQHTLWGYGLVSQSRLISYHGKAVIRSHHERWDGSGYPDGLARERIPEFARIAAVADVYDAITSERHHQRAASHAAGHATIVAGSGTQFDPQVVDAFRRVIAPYPPGTEVALRDGRRALVVSVPETSLHRPEVRIFAARDGEPIEPVDVQLAERPELSIAPAAPVALAGTAYAA